MKSSPLLSFFLVALLFVLVAWGIFQLTSSKWRFSSTDTSAAVAKLESGSKVEQTDEDGLDEDGQNAILEIQYTPGLEWLRLEDPNSDFVMEFHQEDDFPVQGNLRKAILIPDSDYIEWLVDARVQTEAKATAALAIELQVGGQFLPQQTFWLEADTQGKATLVDVLKWQLK